MQDNTVFNSETQSAAKPDLLTEVLRQGTQKLVDALSHKKYGERGSS